jgi:hypothetical protein
MNRHEPMEEKMSQHITSLDIIALHWHRNVRNIKYKPEIDIVKKGRWDFEAHWDPIIGVGCNWWDDHPNSYELSMYLPNLPYGSFKN